MQLPEYIKRWTWDERVVQGKTAVSKMAGDLAKEVADQDDILRRFSGTWTESGNRIAALRRRGEGSLLVRNLDEVGSSMRMVATSADFRAARAVAGAKFYVHTRNMRTMLVVVKKASSDDFVKQYDSPDFVIPGSLQEVERDNDYFCYAVTVVAENMDDFKTYCKERTWHVRDFAYDPNAREAQEQTALETVREYLRETAAYAGQLESAFSHLSIIWIHVKALKIFVESTLLYGMPPEFRAFVIAVSPKNVPKVHKELEAIFGDGTQNEDDEGVGGDNEFHPYVSFQLNLAGLFTGKGVL